MSSHITINGRTYASVEEMPPEVRRQYESAMQMLSKSVGERAVIAAASDVNISTQSSGGPVSHTEYTTISKVTTQRIVVNGKEYSRWEDVPSEIRAAFQSAGIGIDPLAPPSNAARRQVQSLRPSSAGHQTFSSYGISVDVDVDDRPGFLSIGWRWFDRKTFWVFTLLCIPVWAIAIHWFRSDHSLPNIIGLIATFILCPIAVVMTTYNVLCLYFNSTKITLTRSELVITRGPLPYGRNLRLPVDDIQRFDSDQVFVPLRNVSWWQRFIYPGNLEKQNRWVYSLKARMADGSVVQLLGLRTPEFAEFLQSALEKQLRTLRHGSAVPGQD